MAVLLTGAMLLAGCHRTVSSPDDISVESEVSPRPPQVGVSTIGLRLADREGHPITGARIRMEAMMSHPGMPPIRNEFQELESGRYQGSVEFVMAGDWVVLLQITLPNGRQIERRLDVKGVRPG